MTSIVIGIGSNLENPLQQVRRALQHLQQIPQLSDFHYSPLYQSDALLKPGAPGAWDKPFINMAVRAQTSLSPQALLTELKSIERKMGRQERGHWSAREIDFDILVFGRETLSSSHLTIPHTHLLERPFALWPLLDVWPEWSYPEIDKTLQAWGNRFDGNAPLHTRQIAQRASAPYLVGIVNLTLDSFSDGGRFVDVDRALYHIEQLAKAGADVIDIGAESTRPGATPVTPEEEWQRLEPLLEQIPALWTNCLIRPAISLDTYHQQTVAQALSYGIDWVNDQSGCHVEEIVAMLVGTEVGYISMHNLGIPANKSITLPINQPVLPLLKAWCEQRYHYLIQLGLLPAQILLDVGVGFGKTAQQNRQLLQQCYQLTATGVPLMIGHSRKSFLNPIMAIPYADRDLETAVLSVDLADQGVRYLRVHDIEATQRALRVKEYMQLP